MRIFVKILCALLLISVFGFGVYYYGTQVPVRMEVIKHPDSVYLGEKIAKNSVEVELVSFLGRRASVKNPNVEQRANDIVVSYGQFSSVVPVKTLSPEDFRVIYNGKAYSGKPLDLSKLSVIAVYPGGVEKEVEILSAPEDAMPFAENVQMTIETPVGEVVWDLDLITPNRIEAYYDSDIQAGDPFDKSHMSVVIYYPDNTELQVEEFEVVGAPSHLSSDTVVTVVCEYGSAELMLKPANQQRLLATYNGKVYAGDTLDPSCVTMTMIGSDGAEHQVDELWFDDIGYIKANTRVGVHSHYGSGECYVEVIPVKECTADISGELVEGSPIFISGIQIRYEDDNVRILSQDEITFSNLGDTYRSGDFDAWFEWHGMHFSFPLLVIPSEVASLRDRDANVSGMVFTTYSLTEAQIDTIAILCQRAAGGDIMLAAAEASLLANRFELYGGGDATDGAWIVKYMKEDGYWGSGINEYLRTHDADQTVRFVVRDALINGHRIFPAYVDDRADIYSIVRDSTDGVYQQFATELVKADGGVFWFYSFVSDSNSVAYGYTDDAYRRITGSEILYEHMPPEVLGGAPGEIVIDGVEEVPQEPAFVPGTEADSGLEIDGYAPVEDIYIDDGITIIG